MRVPAKSLDFFYNFHLNSITVSLVKSHVYFSLVIVEMLYIFEMIKNIIKAHNAYKVVKERQFHQTHAHK